jgi:hypothetical protein
MGNVNKKHDFLHNCESINAARHKKQFVPRLASTPARHMLDDVPFSNQCTCSGDQLAPIARHQCLSGDQAGPLQPSPAIIKGRLKNFSWSYADQLFLSKHRQGGHSNQGKENM